MTYTDRLRLQLPALDDELWNDPLVADLRAIDATFLGSFAVVTAELPSTTLNYIVRGGTYYEPTDGSFATVPDFTVQTVAPSAITYIYLTIDGTLGTGADWPAANAGKFVPLAIVTSGPSAITAIADARQPLALIGS